MESSVFAMKDSKFLACNAFARVVLLLAIVVKGVLIKSTLSGNMEHAGVNKAIPNMILNASRTKLDLIVLINAMLVLSMINNKKDAYHVLKDALAVRVVMFAFNVALSSLMI